MIWSFPSLRTYWVQIFNSVSVCTRTKCEPSAALTALFGILPPTLQLPKYEADFVAFVNLLAKCLILLRWKSPVPPSHSSWIKDILHFVRMEKLRCTVNSNCDYLQWHCDCDMICHTGRNDHFYIIILFFTDKHINMIMVWFLQRSAPNKDVFLSL